LALGLRSHEDLFFNPAGFCTIVARGNLVRVEMVDLSKRPLSAVRLSLRRLSPSPNQTMEMTGDDARPPPLCTPLNPAPVQRGFSIDADLRHQSRGSRRFKVELAGALAGRN
jgi:hypothetical protein